MSLDILDLTAFYATPLGGLARRLIAHKVRTHWRRAEGETIIALGFGTPYLGSYRGEARRIGAFMPASQGALVWPASGPVNTVLVEEARLPLADNSVDKLLAVHCLELSEQARPLLREMWRVLAPEGQLLLIVPNRLGVWSRREATPFGHGQPYSRTQLERLLNDVMLTPTHWSTALHALPVRNRFGIRWAPTMERFGARLWPRFAGVIIVEARKEVTAPIPSGSGSRRSPQVATVRGMVTNAGSRRDDDVEQRQSDEP
jgi:SAM-dependent methyltransferase